MNDLLAPTPPEPEQPGTERGDATGTALAAARDMTSEIFRLLQSTAAHATNGWSLATLMRSVVPELEEVFASREALEREVTDLRANATSGADTVREMEAQLATREAGWRAERAALEAEVAREQDQARSLAEDLARRRTELEMLEGRTRRLREQMEGIGARAHADREETLRLARDMVQSAEDARLALLDEMESLRTALITEQSEQARANQGAAEREAELARVRQILEQLEASRASTAAELARVRAGLVHTEGELLAAQHEYQLAQVQIDRLLGAHDDLVEDRAQLTAKLHDASEREARLRLRVNGLEQRLHAVREGGGAPDDDAAAQTSVAEAQVSDLATRLSRADERTRTLENELATVKATAGAAAARVETLQDQVRESERARTAAEAKVAELRAAVTTLEQARDTRPASTPDDDLPPVVESIDAAPMDAADEEPVATPADDVATPLVAAPELAAPDLDPEPVTPIALDAGIDEIAIDDPANEVEGADEIDDAPWSAEPAMDATLAPVTPETAAPEPAADAPTPDEAPVAVTALDVAGWDCACVDPAEATERVRDLTPATLLVNLATPGAIAAVAALRTEALTTPLWACAVAPGAAAGVAIGRFDAIARPVDPDRVAAQLAPLVPRGASVVMIGTESATLIPLRQGLLRIGATVKTAWTVAQAADLTAAATPGAVIVDLAADQAGVAAFVASLAERDQPPALIVVTAQPAATDGFADALRTHAGATTGTDRTALVRAAGLACPPRA